MSNPQDNIDFDNIDALDIDEAAIDAKRSAGGEAIADDDADCEGCKI